MHNEHHLALIDTYRHHLVRAATRLLGPADAEDAVQDAYVRALEANTEKLNVAQAWLLTVVRNLAIDRLRRDQWMQQWLLQASAQAQAAVAHPAEADAALAQEVALALQLVAAHLTPEDGALLLLHEVFEASHAEIAQAAGKSEAASRQQLRRALARLRQAAGAHKPWAPTERDADEEAVLGAYLQALQLHDPQTLWAMLGQPPIQGMGMAMSAVSPLASHAASAPAATASGVVQVGGRLCLVLTLDGVTLCVLPLGTQSLREGELTHA